MPLALEPKLYDYTLLAQELLRENPLLRDRLVKNCLLQISEVENALSEVIRFLSLIAYHNEKLTPSQKVDDVWHEFILFTKVYSQFCQHQFNRFIHHHPGGSRVENERQYNRTLKLYEIQFGSANLEYWPKLKLSQCGGCSSFLD